MNLIEFQILDKNFDQDGNKTIEYLDSQNNVIGNGQYENFQKSGTWTEVIEVYGEYIITAKGDYNQDKKQGKWTYSINDQTLGTKTYNQDREIGNSFSYFIYRQPNISNNIWYLVEEFLLYEGKRITQSYIFNFNKFIQCGNYLMGGIKKGKWIELEQNSIIFDQQKQIYSFICSEGSYADGLKEGPWESTLYEQYEHQVHTHLVSKGEYQKGKKTGNWTEPIGYSSKATMQTIITGNYENNQKNGHWSLEDGQKDLYPDEDYDHEGNYNLDKKVDNWKEIRIYQNFHVDSIIRIQDEGQYNDDGQRNDNWTSKTSGHTGNYFYQNGVLNGEAELYDCIGNLKIVLTRSKGQFNNGKKNGRWKTSINIDEKWMLYDVGEYVDDIKVGLWRESQYFDQYILEQTEKDQGQILLIKEGHYGNNGKKKDEWTWRFKCLSGDYNENQIFNIIGKEVHTENQIIGNMILFEETFGKYYARFYFCDIFDGQIFNGYRNGEWKFSVIQDLIQNEINSKDTDSEQEQNLDEEEQNIEEEDHNSNNEEEQEQEEHNDNDNNDNKEEEENNNNEEENEIEQQNSGEEGDDQEDPGNQVFQVYQNGIVIPP
ncbi:unnamed protein product [Paramecium octaurelia]|uniref:Uncharacterized protein n=1 Tax=Paramecium octaurelia TaxID=43137 RepID=A0A8S1XSV7_PAROT|nr:unnamed protein product [Paramecium octaurelia]